MVALNAKQCVRRMLAGYVTKVGIAAGLVMMGMASYVQSAQAQSPIIAGGRMLAQYVTDQSVPTGTQVSMLLLHDLQSGITPKGQEVKFLVLDDVMVNGYVWIHKGTIARGTVGWSRRGTLENWITNNPARLALTIDQTTDIFGRPVRLTLSSVGKSNMMLHAEEAIEMAIKVLGLKHGKKPSKAADEAWRKVLDLFGSVKSLDPETTEGRKGLALVTKALELSKAAEMISDDRVSFLSRALDSLLKGDIVGVLRNTPLSTLHAIIGASQEVERFLRRSLKVRNIHVKPMTPFVAYVADEVMKPSDQ